MNNEAIAYLFPLRGITYPTDNRGLYEKLGFRLLGNYDRENLSMIPPPGWTVQQVKGQKDLLGVVYDAKGRLRVSMISMIYANDPDLHTYSILEPRYSVEHVTYTHDGSNVPAYRVYYVVDRQNLFLRIHELGRVSYTDVFFQEEAEYLRNMGNNFLDARFSKWRDPLAYWQ